MVIQVILRFIQSRKQLFCQVVEFFYCLPRRQSL